MAERVSGDFNIDWNYSIQELTAIRRTKMSQQEMAGKIGVSLKSIQRFENFKSYSAKIMYFYKNEFNS